MQINEIPTALSTFKIRDDFKLDLTTSEMKILYTIHKEKKVTKEELMSITKLEDDVIDFILNRLKKKDLATTKSPEWILTKKGNEIIKEFNNIYPKVEKIVENDPLLSNISKITRNV